MKTKSSRIRSSVQRLEVMQSLLLLPAVDVSNGQAVRLVQGNADSATEYGDALSVALDWQSAGATWIHLVDLDAAFSRGSNRQIINEVIGKLDVNVQLSGGIRDEESLQAALQTGATRINLGTAALEDPIWTSKVIREHGDRIAIALDVRGTVLAARGWTRDGGDLWETFDQLENDGCARYIVTDVTKDGTLRGPNIDLLKQVCARTDKPVIASGGVAQLSDLIALRELVSSGLEGTIAGKALYAGAFTLEEAIEVAGPQQSFRQVRK